MSVIKLILQFLLFEQTRLVHIKPIPWNPTLKGGYKKYDFQGQVSLRNTVRHFPCLECLLEYKGSEKAFT